jgi:hypothetical protein
VVQTLSSLSSVSSLVGKAYADFATHSAIGIPRL